MRERRLRTSVAGTCALALVLAACGGNGDDDADVVDDTADETTEPEMDEEADLDDDVEDEVDDEDAEAEDADAEAAGDLETITGGFVSGMDQMGLPAALDVGFFEDQGLDVELAQPFPTGVDALNALEAGEIQFTQVGTPSIGAVLSGMDLVYLGNYSGSATQLGIDETMALVAREGSDIDPDDLSTLEGKSIGVSVGSINHLYVLGILEEQGIDPDDVEIANTPPPEMPVALATDGLDAIAVWDPWPIIATQDAPGAYEVSRGGGYIAYIGYIVAQREFVEENPDLVASFLEARAEADQWMRENPDQAADVATRWLPGTADDVAAEAMEHNVRQLDPRLSMCNYMALHVSQELLLEVDAIEETYEVSEYFMPEFLLELEEERPELFEDLDPIPEDAQIEPGHELDPDAALEACGTL
jgi:sulfonate transport system substrate-binding protein